MKCAYSRNSNSYINRKLSHKCSDMEGSSLLWRSEHNAHPRGLVHCMMTHSLTGMLHILLTEQPESLELGAANFFYKGPHVSILGLAGHSQFPCIFFFGVLLFYNSLRNAKNHWQLVGLTQKTKSHQAERSGIWNQSAQIQILTPPLTSCYLISPSLVIIVSI